MTGKNPNYRETVEKLRKALIGHAPNGDNLLKPDQQAAVRDALAMLTAQADELATLRAENAEMREILGPTTRAARR